MSEVETDDSRRERWRSRLAAVGPSERAALDPVASFELLEEYGVPTAMPRLASSPADAVRIADSLGYPVVLKTGEPAIVHKSDVGGVVTDLTDAGSVKVVFSDLTARLGPRVLVQRQAEPGTELALGVVRDPLLGPLVLLATGGTLIEVLAKRRVALPPLDVVSAGVMLDGLGIQRLLAGVRGRPPVDRGAVVDALIAVSQLAVELGDLIEAMDVNPLVVSSAGVLAVDALVVPAGGGRGW